MSAESGAVTSRFFEDGRIDGPKPMIGRPIFPMETSDEDYRRQGSPVRDGRIDVYLTSVIGGDEPGYYIANELGDDGDDIGRFEITGAVAEGVLGSHPDDRERYAGYVALAAHIEERVGRTGLTIVIS